MVAWTGNPREGATQLVDNIYKIYTNNQVVMFEMGHRGLITKDNTLHILPFFFFFVWKENCSSLILKKWLGRKTSLLEKLEHNRWKTKLHPTSKQNKRSRRVKLKLEPTHLLVKPSTFTLPRLWINWKFTCMEMAHLQTQAYLQHHLMLWHQ